MGEETTGKGRPGRKGGPVGLSIMGGREHRFIGRSASVAGHSLFFANMNLLFQSRSVFLPGWSLQCAEVSLQGADEGDGDGWEGRGCCRF